MKTTTKQKELITALVSDQTGEIFELEGYAAVGMAGSAHVPLSRAETVNMPHGSELMFLPDRMPVLYNTRSGQIETLEENPYQPGEPVFPVAAFNSPGYVISLMSAYAERARAKVLPLFSYGAVGWLAGRFRSAAILVDREKRQDLRRMRHEKVISGVHRMREKMPKNRLRAHLEKCALEYGCPAAKNFFLQRYEAPLPTSKHCNARCRGCLSLQEDSEIPISQERIAFTPAPEEIAEVALAHIQSVKNSVVSFGQGCEGDPLLAVEVIEPAVRLIRAATPRGTIHMNTNASRPDTLEKLFKAGLDSMRVSMNSVRQKCYTKYFQPKGYTYQSVLQSIDRAIQKEKFVSVNYLNCPGFTDTPEELKALKNFLRKYPVNMIQWRNLNFDPAMYWKTMNAVSANGPPMGMRNLLRRIHKDFPKLKYGYFNPPKERFGNPPQSPFTKGEAFNSPLS
ncbi:radical SAM protein [Thermodesulfobacteriota bacterium]